MIQFHTLSWVTIIRRFESGAIFFEEEVFTQPHFKTTSRCIRRAWRGMIFPDENKEESVSVGCLAGWPF
jgi:hypothetical protein